MVRYLFCGRCTEVFEKVIEEGLHAGMGGWLPGNDARRIAMGPKRLQEIRVAADDVNGY